MKLEWLDHSTGRCGIFITELGRFDSPPIVNNFWLDSRPINLNNDRMALAAALLFGSNSYGEFHLPRDASAVMAECINELASPGFRSVQPIDWGPKPIPEGSSVLRISEPNQDSRRMEFTGSDTINVINFELLRSSRFAGALMGMGLVTLASNAWLFNKVLDEGPIAGESLLAVAVLFAEDLGCNTIEIVGPFVPFKAPLPTLRRMLEATGLNLVETSVTVSEVAR